jgi:hypothetical protein
MSMSNLFCPQPLFVAEMATSGSAPIGLWHPTVVPTNFEPAESDPADDGS